MFPIPAIVGMGFFFKEWLCKKRPEYQPKLLLLFIKSHFYEIPY